MFNLDTIKTREFSDVNKLMTRSQDFLNSFHADLNDSFRSNRSLKNLNFDSIKLSQDYESLKVK